MSALRLEDGSAVSLGAVIARAGEGVIYEVSGHGDWVAKIFHPELKDVAAKRAKVAAMIKSPPPGAVQADGFVVLTWPLHLIEDEHGVVGYVMSRVDTANAVEIHTVSNPANRASPLPSAPQWPLHVTWHHLVNVAANLCLAVESVHRVNAVIGDFQERNILVNDTTRVTLVDCDSMQFIDREGHQFLCGVGRPEFTAPELAGANLTTIAREKPSDLFSLAVHIHLLLMAGNHPFLRGEWAGGGDQPDAVTLARTGQWAGGPGSLLRTHPLAPPVDFLPPAIQRLFVRAFTDGSRDPASRPSAAEWRQALQTVVITTCPRGHQVPAEVERCPWCAIDDERAARRSQRPAAPAAAVAAPQVSYPGVSAHPAVAGVPSSSGRRTGLIAAGAVTAVVALGAAGYAAFGGGDDDADARQRSSSVTSSATADWDGPTQAGETSGPTSMPAQPSGAAPPTPADPQVAGETLDDYIAENGIQKTVIRRGEPGGPTIELPTPEGWAPVEPSDDDPYGGLVYNAAVSKDKPPRIRASLYKLTGNIEQAKVLELAPAGLKSLPNFQSLGEPSEAELGGFKASQVGGSYVKNGNSWLVAQKTTVIPTDGGLFVLQLTAEGLESDMNVLMDGTAVIDKEAKITP